ncbi:putative F-box protein At1g47300, partial [Plectropomus leopardus]|uniref:putative F-box protein At1g47300 n=1 Tax=Plectropomus leopardus TaxID=160734 RepID=UPI001C4C682A
SNTRFYMDTLSTCCVEETSYMRGGEEEEEEQEEEDEEEEDGDEERKKENKDESVVQKQQKPAWTPCFYCKTDREMFCFVGQKIVIEGALDSYAGMIWPA